MFAGLMVFNNSSASVTNHFYFSLLTHIYIERNVLTQSDAYTHINTHTVYAHTYINTDIQAYKYSYTELHPAIEHKVLLSHPSVSVSFEFKLFWHVEWLGVFRGYSYWCIRDTSVSETWVCVCLFMCVSASVKTKRQSSEYFIPVRCLSPALHCNADHWNTQGCTRSQTNTKQIHTHTNAPVQSAGVVVDSEGLVCRGFVPERPPCKHTCRQDLKPCCTPASPPLSPDTNPAHKQAPR